MIQVIDNFSYKGKKPNFERDQFDTLSDMKSFPVAALDDGHVAYCKETEGRYIFNSNNTSTPDLGKWRKLSNAVRGGSTSSIPNNPTVGDYYYDINLNSVIYYNGTEWVSTTAQQFEDLKALIDAKVIEAGGVAFDTEPKEGSTNPVTSNGIFAAFKNLESKVLYLTEAEYDNLLNQGAILDDVEYNIYEE